MSNTEDKIQQLQMMEQSLQNILAQKQSFQMQLAEVESALKELATASKAYKIIANIMVNSDKGKLKQELEKKKELITLRISTLQKQEENIRRKADELRKDALMHLKKARQSDKNG